MSHSCWRCAAPAAIPIPPWTIAPKSVRMSACSVGSIRRFPQGRRYITPPSRRVTLVPRVLGRVENRSHLGASTVVSYR